MFNGGFGRAIGGLMLLGAGVLLLLNMLGIISVSIGELFSYFGRFWPVFVILAGLSQLSQGHRSGGAIFGGLIVTAIGAFFLAKNLDFIHVPTQDFFKYAIPVVLIAAGMAVLFRPSRRNHTGDRPTRTTYEPPVPPPMDNTLHPDFSSTVDEAFEQAFPNEARRRAEEQRKTDEEKRKFEDFEEQRRGMNERGHLRGHNHNHRKHGHHEKVNHSGFIGDVRIGDHYFELKPTNISHFIGDTIIDLTKAQIPYGETQINVSAFIGDVKIFIPADADLGIAVTSSSLIGDMKVLKEGQGGFMSSVTSHTPNYNETGKRIKLNVSVFVGDVRVNTVG